MMINPSNVQAMAEGRLRRVYARTSLIVDVLNWCNAPDGTALSIPKGCALPEDAEIIEVSYDAARRSLCFIVAHPSFGKVALGGVIPEHPDYWDRQMAVMVKGEPPPESWRDRPQML